MSGWGEERTSTPGECYQLWCHRGSGAFYAVRLLDGRIQGACPLRVSAALAGRHGLGPDDFEPAVGMQVAGEREAFTIVEEWPARALPR
jgi:hypothetical protein